MYNRFASVRASIIEVGKADSTVANMIQALQQARETMSQDDLTTSLYNVVIVTDRNVSEIGTVTQTAVFGNQATIAKNNGVKITVINAGNDTLWGQYASNESYVFTQPDFETKLESWHIQRSLCQGNLEPSFRALFIKYTDILFQIYISKSTETLHQTEHIWVNRYH